MGYLDYFAILRPRQTSFSQEICKQKDDNELCNSTEICHHFCWAVIFSYYFNIKSVHWKTFIYAYQVIIKSPNNANIRVIESSMKPLEHETFHPLRLDILSCITTINLARMVGSKFGVSSRTWERFVPIEHGKTWKLITGTYRVPYF